MGKLFQVIFNALGIVIMVIVLAFMAIMFKSCSNVIEHNSNNMTTNDRIKKIQQEQVKLKMKMYEIDNVK